LSWIHPLPPADGTTNDKFFYNILLSVSSGSSAQTKSHTTHVWLPFTPTTPCQCGPFSFPLIAASPLAWARYGCTCFVLGPSGTLSCLFSPQLKAAVPECGDMLLGRCPLFVAGMPPLCVYRRFHFISPHQLILFFLRSVLPCGRWYPFRQALRVLLSSYLSYTPLCQGRPFQIGILCPYFHARLFRAPERAWASQTTRGLFQGILSAWVLLSLRVPQGATTKVDPVIGRTNISSCISSFLPPPPMVFRVRDWDRRTFLTTIP